MTVKTTNMRLENLDEAIRWLSENRGEMQFTDNSVVIRCLGKADMCEMGIVRHDPTQAVYIGIQRVYSKVRESRLPDTSRTGARGKDINVTGKATRTSFVVRPPKPKA